jgi:thiol:disulfide interchange protein DsbA
MLARALMAAVVLAVIATIANAAGPVADRDYSVLKPAQRTDSPGKIEVIEFFSYGCPHCANVHPRVSAWLAKLPEDVAFKRVPVSFGRPQWANFARTYYALESVGQTAKVESALYEAIHTHRLQLNDEASITAWMGKHGVDPAAFRAAFTSFGVNTKVGNADKMTRDYRISGVPTFTVAGRYVVIAPSEAQTLAATDAIIAMARGEKVAAQP